MPEIDEGVYDGRSEQLTTEAMMGPTQRNVQVALDKVVQARVEVPKHVRVQINAWKKISSL